MTAIIFVVALSEYNLKLEEDLVTNRMMESLKLFNDVVNNRWFAATNVILFLNKKDIFATKIRTVPLTVCFADYTGPSEYDAALKFINEKFQSTLVTLMLWFVCVNGFVQTPTRMALRDTSIHTRHARRTRRTSRRCGSSFQTSFCPTTFARPVLLTNRRRCK